MLRSIARARILAWLVLGALGVVLGAEYLLSRPVSGMGGSFDTPQAAVTVAFGPTGWLEEVARFTVHDQAETDEGRVFVYSGYPRATAAFDRPPSVFGIADAKPSWRGWYAHGMMAVQRPPQLTGENLLSCTIALRPAVGQRFLVIAGYVRQADVVTVEIELGTGRAKRVPVQNATFAVLAPENTEVTQLRAINQQGNVLQSMGGASCT